MCHPPPPPYTLVFFIIVVLSVIIKNNEKTFKPFLTVRRRPFQVQGRREETVHRRRATAQRRPGRRLQRRGRSERVAELALFLRLAAAERALQEENRRSVRRPDRRDFAGDEVLRRRRRLPDTVVHVQVFGRLGCGGHRTQEDCDAQKREYCSYRAPLSTNFKNYSNIHFRD